MKFLRLSIYAYSRTLAASSASHLLSLVSNCCLALLDQRPNLGLRRGFFKLINSSSGQGLTVMLWPRISQSAGALRRMRCNLNRDSRGFLGSCSENENEIQIDDPPPFAVTSLSLVVDLNPSPWGKLKNLESVPTNNTMTMKRTLTGRDMVPPCLTPVSLK